MPADRHTDALLPRLTRAAWTGRWAFAVALVATITPAVVLTYAQDRPYRAEAYMLIRQLPSDVVAETTVADPVRRLSNEIVVLEGDEVAAKVRDDLGIGGDVPRVRGSISTQVDVIVARVDSVSAELATQLANAYVQAYIDVQTDRLRTNLMNAVADLQAELAALQSQLDALGVDPAQQAARAELADRRTRIEATLQLLTADLAVAAEPAENIRPATGASDRRSPSLFRPVLLSTIVGLALGSLGSLLMNRRAGEVRTAADLATLRSTEPVLAVVPPDRSRSARPIAVRPSTQATARSVDSYERVCASVQRASADRGVGVVQICSPHPRSGATTVAVNVGVLLARGGSRVALVDLDLRSPTVHSLLGLERGPGVTDALAEAPEARLDDLLLGDPHGSALMIPTSRFEELAVITAGTAPRSALEVLSRRRLDDLIGQLRETYDLVILDSPAVLVAGDAAAIARHADAAVVVVRSGVSTMRAVRRALGVLDRSGARILGVVLTAAEE